MLCQKPHANERAFFTFANACVFSVFFNDTVVCEGYIAYETLVTWYTEET
jgi:hypothetical protein